MQPDYPEFAAMAATMSDDELCADIGIRTRTRQRSASTRTNNTYSWLRCPPRLCHDLTVAEQREHLPLVQSARSRCVSLAGRFSFHPLRPELRVTRQAQSAVKTGKDDVQN